MPTAAKVAEGKSILISCPLGSSMPTNKSFSGHDTMRVGKFEWTITMDDIKEKGEWPTTTLPDFEIDQGTQIGTPTSHLTSWGDMWCYYNVINGDWSFKLELFNLKSLDGTLYGNCSKKGGSIYCSPEH